MQRVILALLLLTACSTRTPAPATIAEVPTPAVTNAPPPAPTTIPEVPEEPEATPAPASGNADGDTCLLPTDCASGVCEGQGCDDHTPGLCAPALRACTRDLVTYCGCDDVIFRTSGSCSGRRYAHKGSCVP